MVSIKRRSPLTHGKRRLERGRVDFDGRDHTLDVADGEEPDLSPTRCLTRLFDRINGTSTLSPITGREPSRHLLRSEPAVATLRNGFREFS
jgi:hypothetical protein